jgi:hypothetical protein
VLPAVLFLAHTWHRNRAVRAHRVAVIYWPLRVYVTAKIDKASREK